MNIIIHKSIFTCSRAFNSQPHDLQRIRYRHYVRNISAKVNIAKVRVNLKLISIKYPKKKDKRTSTLPLDRGRSIRPRRGYDMNDSQSHVFFYKYSQHRDQPTRRVESEWQPKYAGRCQLWLQLVSHFDCCVRIAGVGRVVMCGVTRHATRDTRHGSVQLFFVCNFHYRLKLDCVY